MQLELQSFLFKKEPTRRELLAYKPNQPSRYKIQVFRNHSFELVEHTIAPYLDYAGLGVSFTYSGYDDSLSFFELDSSADLVLLWIDASRYSGGSVAPLLEERVAQLRKKFTGPILVVPYGEDVSLKQAGVVVMDLSGIRKALGEGFIDLRAQAVTGTPLSSKAMLLIARELGLRYLPAMLRPALKAVIVDFDNTLYRGVLGEDSPEGLVLTEGHQKLQTCLKKLSAEGFFLCGASKNDPADVEELFEKRRDFPLEKKDFSRLFVSWEPKADSIGKAAAFLNIDPDSMVFVDDNIGELTAVEMAYPAIRTVHAEEDAAVTCRVLESYPGLSRIGGSAEDAIRKTDVQANETRHALQAELSPEEYIRSLEIELTFSHDDRDQLQRISELSNKTNQFIFNYCRYTPADIEMRMALPEYIVVAISLRDKLSDSGLIGVCVGRDRGTYAELEECYISCRALGRGVDHIIVLEAIRQIAEHFGRSQVKALFQKGPRNAPAEKFVQENLSAHLKGPAPFSFHVPEGLITVNIC